ncbi:MAG: DUF4347 domain-containing protein, partial [Crocosphaera sp.]
MDNLTNFSSSNSLNPHHELIFIDQRVNDYQSLVNQITLTHSQAQLGVIYLDATQDGIEQISQRLAQYQTVSAVHIISHGNEGTIDLGNVTLDNDTLINYSGHLQNWGNHLSTDADILFYGCHVASGVEGTQFIQQLETLTGADIAASTDDTGGTALGGNWDLEVQTGVLETTALFAGGEANGYKYLLASDTIEGSEGNDTFTFDQDEITGSNNLDTVNRYNSGDIVTVLGKGGNDTFTLPTGKSPNNLVPEITIDAGNGTDTLDLSGVKKDLTFNVGSKIGEGVSIEGTNVNKITDLEVIKGGKKENIYNILDSWDSAIEIIDTVNDGDEGILDFTSFTGGQQSLNVIVNNNNQLTVEKVNNTAINITATGIAKVKGSTNTNNLNNLFNLDLSNVTSDITIDISSNDGTLFIKIGNNDRLSFEGVASLKLGQNINTIKLNSFNADFSGTILPPNINNNYEVVLDYDSFLSLIAEVNLGTGSLNAGLGQLQQNKTGNVATQGTWNLIRSNTDSFKLNFGGSLTSEINLSDDNANNQTLIKNALEGLDNVKSATVTGEGTTSSPWVINVTAKTRNTPSLSSENSDLVNLIKLNNNQWNLSFDALSGSFKLGITGGNRNFTDEINIIEAQADSTVLKQALFNAGITNNINDITITGIGTVESPWEITLPDNKSLINIDTLGLTIDSLNKISDDTWDLNLNDLSNGNTFALGVATETNNITLSNSNKITVYNGNDLITALDKAGITGATITGYGTQETPWKLTLPDGKTLTEINTNNNALSASFTKNANTNQWDIYLIGDPSKEFSLLVQGTTNNTETNNITLSDSNKITLYQGSDLITALNNAGITGAKITGYGTQETPWKLTLPDGKTLTEINTTDNAFSASFTKNANTNEWDIYLIGDPSKQFSLLVEGTTNTIDVDIAKIPSNLKTDLENAGISGATVTFTDNIWTIELSDHQTLTYLMTSSNSLGTLTQRNDITWEGIIKENEGAFKVKITNGNSSIITNPIDIATAKLDANSLIHGLNDLDLDLVGLTNITVTGTGNNLDPWQLVLSKNNSAKDDNILIELTAVNNGSLSLIQTQVATSPTLAEWSFYNTANGGSFKLNFNGQKTEALRFDAAPEEIKTALSKFNNIGVVEVTGEGTQTSPWIIQLADTDYDFNNLSLTVENAENTTINNQAITGLSQGTQGLNITKIIGGSKKDKIYGNDINTPLTIEGGSNHDSIVGGSNNDSIEGGSGKDTLSGDQGQDTIKGGSGDDTLSGGEGNDSLEGGTDDDHLYGKTGNDTLKGGTGEDTLSGGQGDDLLAGEQSHDSLIGGAGDDTLSGGAGNDTLLGEAGDDNLIGGSGTDTLSGGEGNDTLTGNGLLQGGTGNDSITGGKGDDTLEGGEGNDALSGGEGNDTYVFSNGWGQDTLENDIGGDKDKLDFSQVTQKLTYNFSDTQVIITAEDGSSLKVKNKDAVEIFKRSSGTDVLIGLPSFKIDNTWTGSITIEDEIDLDFSDITDDLIFKVENNKLTVIDKENNPTRRIVVNNDTYNLILGQGENTLKFINGGSYNGTLEPPQSNNTILDHKVILDYSENIQSSSVNVGSTTVEASLFLEQHVNDKVPLTEVTWKLFTEADNGSFHLISNLLNNDSSLSQDVTDEISIQDAKNNADLIRERLQTLYLGNGNSFKTLTVTGNGTFDNPWVITFADTLKRFPYLSLNNVRNLPNIEIPVQTITGINQPISGDLNITEVKGGSPNDRLLGSRSISGDRGDDFLVGGSDRDTLKGEAGNDFLQGDEGADELFGGQDQDWLFGGTESDTLLGGTGDDTLLGEEGNDSLLGGDDNDDLIGGEGNDTLDGGEGNDQFIFKNNWGHDTITETNKGSQLNADIDDEDFDANHQGNKDSLDFSQVTQGEVTHILNEGKIFSFTGDDTKQQQLKTAQDKLNGWTFSNGIVDFSDTDKNEVINNHNASSVTVDKAKTIEEIVAANTDNTFVFGNDWGQNNTFLSSVLGNIEPDYLTALANKGNRDLIINTALMSNNGHDLVLDLRQITQELLLKFTTKDGVTSLEIRRIEGFSVPFVSLPIPIAPIRFNKIVITNIDENTTIFAGRNNNQFMVDRNTNFHGTIIGGSGVRPLKDLLNPNNFLPAAFSGNLPSLTVENFFEYARFLNPNLPSALSSDLAKLIFSVPRYSNPQLGGLDLKYAFNPFPTTFSPLGVGNKNPQPEGFENATILNIFDARLGGGINSAVGTNLSPTFGIGDTYYSNLPNELKQYLATEYYFGRNTLSAGVGDLFKQFLDSKPFGNFKFNDFNSQKSSDTSKEFLNQFTGDKLVDYKNLLGFFSPGIHTLAGLTGPDTYRFNGMWGLGIVLEPPTLTNAVPESIDILDFSGVNSDLHVTVFEANADIVDVFAKSQIDLDIGIGTNLVFTTTFDTTGMDVGTILLNSLKLGYDDAFTQFRESLNSFNTAKDLLNSLKIDGGSVIATDIESIVGSKGKTTVHLRDGAELLGRVTGKNVVLDYGDYNTSGVTVDVGSAGNYKLDLVELITGKSRSEFSQGTQDALNFFLGSYKGSFGGASGIQGNRGLSLTDFLEGVGLDDDVSSIPVLSDILFALENTAIINTSMVTGTSGNDVLKDSSSNNSLFDTVGFNNNNTFIGLGGSDTVDGGAGIDIFSYASLDGLRTFNDAVTINLGTGKAWTSSDTSKAGKETFSTVNGSYTPGTDVDISTLSNIEEISGGQGNDLLIGDSKVNTYYFTKNWGQDIVIDKDSNQNVLDFTGVSDSINQISATALLNNGSVGNVVVNTSTQGGSSNEVQTLTVSATQGQFILGFTDSSNNISYTSPLDYNISASNLETALEALDSVTDVTVTQTGTTYTITFKDNTTNINQLKAVFYDNNFTLFQSGSNEVTAFGDFKINPNNSSQINVLKPAVELSKTTPVSSNSNVAAFQTIPTVAASIVPASSTTTSDQEKISTGLSNFGDWAANFGTKLDDAFSNLTNIPLIGDDLSNILDIGGEGTNAQEITNKIQTQLQQVIEDAFNKNDTITTETIINSSALLRATDSTNLREFGATLNLASFQDNINLDFSADVFSDFGLEVNQSTPINLIGDLSLDFTFGLDTDDQFFIANPNLIASLSLDHSDTLDLSLTFGPLGVGVEDGTINFDVAASLGTDGRLNIDTMTGDTDGSLMGDLSLDGDASYNLYLPIQLQGALAGLQDEPGVISAYYGGGDAGEDTSLVGFFGSLATSLGSVELDELIQFKDLSFDVVLDGAITALDTLVDPDGIASQDIPLIDQSLVDILGSNSVDVMTQIKNTLGTIRDNLSDIQTFEVDANFALNSELNLGLTVSETGLKEAIADLQTLSFSLDGNSSNADIARAIIDSDTLSDRLTDRDAIIAYNRLQSISKGLDGNSSDLNIAEAIADPDSLNSVKSDRDLVAGNSDFLDAANLLSSLGLTTEATDSDIETLLRDQPIEQVKDAVTLLQTAQGNTSQKKAINLQIEDSTEVLTDFGFDSTSLPSDAQIEASLNNIDDINTAQEARDLLAAKALLDSYNLEGNASDTEIETVLSDANEIEAAQEARDLLTGAIFVGLQRISNAENLLKSYGIAENADDTTIESSLSNDQAITDAKDARDLVNNANTDIFDAATRLGELGLSGNSSDLDIATILADSETLTLGLSDRNYLNNSEVVVTEAETRLSNLGLEGLTATDDEIALALVENPSLLSDYKADRDLVSQFDSEKLISLAYEDSQLFVGFNLDLGVDTTVSPDLASFLYNIGLPQDIEVAFDSDLNLIGNLSLDFAVGVDLGDLQDGFTDDDLFIQLNDLTLSGGVETVTPLNFDIGFGPLGASIMDGFVDLDVGVNIDLEDGGQGFVSLADLKDQGLSLVTVTPTTASLDANLPVALSVGGETAASTTLEFTTDDLFGDISSLLDQLPSFSDVTNLSITEVLDGLESGLNYVNDLVQSNPDTVAQIPLLNRYVDDTLTFAQEGIDAIRDLQRETQTIALDGTGGTFTLSFDGATTGLLDYNATANEIETALDNLTGLTTYTGGIDVTVTGSGTDQDPWKIVFLDPLGDVTEITADESNLIGSTKGIVIDTLLPDVAAIEDTIESALNLAEEDLEIRFERGALLFDLGLDINVSRDDLAFDLDLATLASLVPDSIAELIAGADDLADLEASGLVSVDFQGRLDLLIGFDPNATLGTAVFIGDETELYLEAVIDAQDLDFTANINLASDALSSFEGVFDSLGIDPSIGAVGISVIDGMARLDGGVDENGDTTPAIFNFVFEADDTAIAGDENAGDGRYFINELSAALITANSGELEVDLPLYFPTESNPLGGSTSDIDGDGINDNSLHIEISDLSEIGASLTVVTPDIKNSIGLYAIVNSVDVVSLIAGKGEGQENNAIDKGILGNIEDILTGEVFGLPLPLIGDKLETAANFVGEFRTDVRNSLNNLSDGDGTIVSLIQGSLYSVFGSDGLNILTDANGDLIIDRNDILITGERDYIQFDLQLGNPTLFSEVVDLDFNAAVPGLGIEFADDVGIRLDVGYDFSFGFGFSLEDGFYLDTSNEDELEVNIEATLENFDSQISLGFLTLDVLDNTIVDLSGNPSGSGVFGKFFVDITDNDNGRLTLSEISAESKKSNLINAGFEGKAEANLKAELGINESQALPKISTDFYFLQEFGLGTNVAANPTNGSSNFGNSPIMEFREVTIDLGSFLGGVVDPILSQIQEYTEPIQPIINVLKTPIPIISELQGNQLTFLDLASQLGGLKSRKFIDA